MNRPGRNKEKETLDYQASLLNPSWASERKFADQIMQYIRRHKLQFELDELTRGRGNCFMIAVLQQLNRMENLKTDIKTIAKNIDHNAFRRMVKKFIDTSSDTRIAEMKRITR